MIKVRKGNEKENNEIYENNKKKNKISSIKVTAVMQQPQSSLNLAAVPRISFASRGGKKRDPENEVVMSYLFFIEFDFDKSCSLANLLRETVYNDSMFIFGSNLHVASIENFVVNLQHHAPTSHYHVNL